jgi:hypothetical protein
LNGCLCIDSAGWIDEHEHERIAGHENSRETLHAVGDAGEVVVGEFADERLQRWAYRARAQLRPAKCALTANPNGDDRCFGIGRLVRYLHIVEHSRATNQRIPARGDSKYDAG